MFRIDNSTAVQTMPTPSPVGTPGYFTAGNVAAGQLATEVTADWANAVQEEIAHVIEGAGMTLDKQNMNQLYEALQTFSSEFDVDNFLALYDSSSNVTAEKNASGKLSLNANNGGSSTDLYNLILANDITKTNIVTSVQGQYLRITSVFDSTKKTVTVSAGYAINTDNTISHFVYARLAGQTATSQSFTIELGTSTSSGTTALGFSSGVQELSSLPDFSFVIPAGMYAIHTAQNPMTFDVY